MMYDTPTIYDDHTNPSFLSHDLYYQMVDGVPVLMPVNPDED
jgi:hypothetical protein